MLYQCQCRRKTFMVHQTFVWWVLYVLYKFVKSPIRHLGLAIGNVRCVRCFSPTLQCTKVRRLRPPKEMLLKGRISVRISGTKIIPSNQKSSFLYLWKISLNFIRYSLKVRNHELIKRWLLRHARVGRTRGLAPIMPIVPLFWSHRALANQSRF